MNFCPYDFKSFDWENIAYEISFYKGWSWEDLKKKTVVGDFIDDVSYVEQDDRVRYSHYSFLEKILEEKGEKCVIFRNNGSDDKIDGLELFKKDLRENGDKGEVLLSFDENLDECGLITLQNKTSKSRIARFFPCCPYCHNRLPLWWKESEDFGAISLYAPTTAGKTTYLCSMIKDNLRVLSNISYRNGSISVTAAHTGANDDAVYNYYKEAAEKLESSETNKAGTCPEMTDKDNWIPPVFLNVQVDINNEEKYLTIGIYDNAGEGLAEMQSETREDYSNILKYSFADFFLFDPADLNVIINRKNNKVQPEVEEKQKFQIMTIEQQAEFQKVTKHSITAEELLREYNGQAKTFVNKAEERTENIYYNYEAKLKQMRNIHPLQKVSNRYFYGIIAKCDLLDSEENRKKYQTLGGFLDRKNSFKRQTGEQNRLDKIINNEFRALQLVQEMQLFNNTNDTMIRIQKTFSPNRTQQETDSKQDTFVTDFDMPFYRRRSNPVAWYFMSAIGCDAEKHGKMYGKYDPICVENPLVSCIIKRIRDNGWDNNE